MNKAQEKAIERIKRSMFERDMHGDDYEVKRFEIDESHSYGTGTIYVLYVVGLKGDEGTMAQVFGRTRRHLAVGKRGGLRLLNGARYSKALGRKVSVKSPIRGEKALYWTTD